MYEEIVKSYKENESIAETAKQTGTSTVHVRRVLITEDLWSSERSDQIKNLFNEGKRAGEIADILGLNLKLVQNYLPYKRGEYNEDQSCDSKRSKRYRLRKDLALSSHERVKKEILYGFYCKYERVNLTLFNDANLAIDSALSTIKENNSSQIVIGGEPKPAWETRGWVMRFSLNLDNANMSSLKRYGQVEQGITRDVAVPLDMPLHNLHYAIQRMFGWRNTHTHCFMMPEDYIDMTANGSFNEIIKSTGSIFRFPSYNYELLHFDDDYEGNESVNTWLKQKYTGPFIYKGSIELPDVSAEKAKAFMTDHFERVASELCPKKSPSDLSCNDMQPYFLGKLGEIRETMTIKELLDITERFTYLYDRKDKWKVDISFKKEGIADIPSNAPYCIKCDGLPVCDDIKGIAGYCRILNEIKTPRVDYEDEGQYTVADYTRIKMHEKGWTGKRKKPKDIL